MRCQQLDGHQTPQLNKPGVGANSRAHSLCFQKRNILINRRAAQITHPCQLGHIQLTILVRWVVQEEDCGDAVLGCLRSAYLLALGSGVRHTSVHAPFSGFYSQVRMTHLLLESEQVAAILQPEGSKTVSDLVGGEFGARAFTVPSEVPP